ncbi:glycine zipper domain-containing protein [Variovorax ginsengisoli]|uniref:DUF883 domain-containing protein n=1 Tax=Variovorax ginsengisoli TaxID=363844 RepID=A0ABT9S624_9BURK|nr:hypothetical protein [Variovorax ginsengisoli]MDP9899813.1 hypothetical protein [Variovorax ginsengisoli]
MPIDSHVLTPQQRLAISRRALVRQLRGDSGDAHANEYDAYDAGPGEDPAHGGALDRPDSNGGANLPWLSVARRVGERWWRRHPANAAAQLAKPLLQRYARERPFKVVGIAAGVGALLVVVKPWRLLSITAIAAAVLKTSDVADLVTTLMHNNNSPRKDPP